MNLSASRVARRFAALASVPHGIDHQATDPAGALEKLHKEAVRSYNRLKDFYRSHLTTFEMRPGWVSVGEGEFEIGIEANDRLRPLLVSADFLPDHVSGRDLVALGRLAKAMLRDAPAKEAGEALRDALSAANSLMPDIPALLDEVTGLVTEMGLAKDASVAGPLELAGKYLRKKEWMWALANVVKAGMAARKTSSPKSKAEVCPGSGTQINLSWAEISQGSVACPQCGKYVRIRGSKENDDFVRTLPRHSP